MKIKICVFSFDSKHLGMLLVFCMLLNGFVPRFNLELKNYQAACRLAVNKAALLTQFFDLPNLSLKIANDLLKKSQKAKGQTENKQKNSANTSSDYSIISFDKKWSVVQHSVSIIGGKLINNAWIQANIPKWMGKLDCHNSTSLYLFCLFLMLLVLLPRGNIKEEIASLLIGKRNQKISSPAKAGLDFLFWYIPAITNFCLSFRHTRESGYPEKMWIPDQVGNDTSPIAYRCGNAPFLFIKYNNDGGIKCNY